MNFWAKKSKDCFEYLTVNQHLEDTAFSIEHLYYDWISVGLKEFFDIEMAKSSEIHPLNILKFLALVHDIGKVSPAFQKKTSGNFELDNYIEERLFSKGFGWDKSTLSVANFSHGGLGQFVLEERGIDSSVSCIIGGHHGKFMYCENVGSYIKANGLEEPWISERNKIFEKALEVSEISESEIKSLKLPKTLQVLFTGLLITADWVASNTDIFPLISADVEADFTDRFENAKIKISEIFKALIWDWNVINADIIFNNRFKFSPNSFQENTVSIAKEIENPGIFIIEAQMGCGKTEAALACAEIFAEKRKLDGLYFALPTQATSNAMFSRIQKWVETFQQKTTIILSHGKAQFNENYRKIMSSNVYEEEQKEQFAYVNSWFTGRKRNLLANAVVGTVDTLLMTALNQKHVTLRHLGLANKVVIIDECHAYDAYMSVYLERVLYFLAKYKIPVIILSATLPYNTRSKLVSAYLSANSKQEFYSENIEYPLVTYTDGTDVFSGSPDKNTDKKEIKINLSDNDDILEILKEKLLNGGSAGVIVNTVKRAQAVYDSIKEIFPNTLLLHSRFLANHRTEKENFLLEKIGKNNVLENGETFVVIGTQVIEQSLDIDFDFMITDICPADLLFQRIGRLHRHSQRKRPENLKNPECVVLKSDTVYEKSCYIYAEYLLRVTEKNLADNVFLPDSIPEIVNKVYCEKDEEFSELYNELQYKLEEKTGDARTWLFKKIEDSRWERDLKDYSEYHQNDTEQAGLASVRDGNPSIEVIVLVKKGDSYYSVDGVEFGTNILPQDSICQKIAREILRLPSVLSYKNTTDYLEKLTRENLPQWQNSTWLKGELFLILNENHTATLDLEKSTYEVSYNKERGFEYERI
jgi:CRISPR-associated endonuclease/helicase Cas3